MVMGGLGAFIRAVPRARITGPRDLPSWMRPPRMSQRFPQLDDLDVNFVNPARDLPAPLPRRADLPFAIEPAPRPWQVGGFEPRDVVARVVPNQPARVSPLSPSEIIEIELASVEDPFRSLMTVVQNYDEAKNLDEFARVLEQSRIVRRTLSMDPRYERMLDSAILRTGRRFGATETDLENAVSPVFYKNNPALPDDIKARVDAVDSRGRQTMGEMRAARTGSEEFRTSTASSISKTKKAEDLEAFDALNNGGLIGRALAAGDITPSDALYLVNQTNYRRVRLLQDSGLLPKSIKNKVRAEGGNRGTELLKETSTLGTEGRKVQVYKAAMHTAETPEELTQAYVLARSDLKSPAYLDELEGIMDSRSTILALTEGSEATRVAPRVRARISEESITGANRAQSDLDAARLEASRPENLGDIVRTPRLDSEGNVVKDVLGETVMDSWEQFGGSRRLYRAGDAASSEGYSMGLRPSPATFEASTAAPASERIFRRNAKSSKNNEPLSALRMKFSDGRTIEEVYQLDVKGYRRSAMENSAWRNEPWKMWMEGKSKPTLKGQTPEELDSQYTDLWRHWFNQNPDQLELAARAIGNRPINDVMAKPGSVSQSKSIHEILVENGLRYSG